MSIEKNKEYVVNIIDQGFEGEGIAKIDNFTIFVPGAIKGEKIKILIVKVNKSFAYGKILEILESSSARNTCVDCSTYKRCGGCNLRHVKYENTLEFKTNMVKNTLKKALNRDIEVKNIIGMENPYYYRNKLQYPVGIENDKPVIGVYANRTHTIIPTESCFIQDEKSQEIANDVFKFIVEKGIKPYNEKDGSGSIRHLLIKVGKKTGDIMLVLVVNNDFKQEADLVDFITAKHKITTVVKNINRENTNVILGKKNVVLYGNGYIQDILGEYKFNISTMAFYQVNPIQTEKLYNTAINLANLTGNEVVYDLYCGIGTISIFLSKHAKKVYGIEIVKEAIDDAKQNAKNNGIENIEFMAGDVEKLLPTILEKDTPDVVFVDPPRKGLDNTSIQNLLKIEPEKIVYISCNPATLARDLNLLEEKYNITEIQPVDLFPFTSHCEVIACLKLKK